MFKLLFLTLFLIIGVLFTLSYSLLPIITFTDRISDINVTIDGNVYINKLTLSAGEEKTTIHYSDLNINDTYKMILQYLYYGCIITSCTILIGIILSSLGMKFFSKILFIIAQIFMVSFSGIILFLVYSPGFIENLISSNLPLPQGFKNYVNTSYGSGGILIIVSSIMMIINYIIYSFIA
jgi:hypothetical protein